MILENNTKKPVNWKSNIKYHTLKKYQFKVSNAIEEYKFPNLTKRQEHLQLN